MIVLEFLSMSRKRQQILKMLRWRLAVQRGTIRWTISENAHWKRTGEELEIR